VQKALAISLTAHIMLLVSLWHFGWERVSVINVPQVYQVQLIAMPEIQPAPPEETIPEIDVETIPPPPEEKKKLKPKRKKAKPKTASSKAAQQRQIGQQDEAVSGVRSDELFQFPYYIRLMTDKISRNWRNPYRGEAETVLATVYFKVLREGRIVGARVENSSGISSFDRAALRAVINSSPLPPLPPEYAESQLTVHLDFEYRRK